MVITVERKWKKDSYTIGNLYIYGKKICNTLEDKDRGLTDKMSAEYIKKVKVYGETAIPSGKYKVILNYSPKFSNKSYNKEFGCLSPLISNVKGFEGIRIHPGNTAKDSLGCLLVGSNTEVGKVLNSQYWYTYIMRNYIYPAWKNKENIWIEFK